MKEQYRRRKSETVNRQIEELEQEKIIKKAASFAAF